jgi:hypothetical protein
VLACVKRPLGPGRSALLCGRVVLDKTYVPPPPDTFCAEPASPPGLCAHSLSPLACRWYAEVALWSTRAAPGAVYNGWGARSVAHAKRIPTTGLAGMASFLHRAARPTIVGVLQPILVSVVDRDGNSVSSWKACRTWPVYPWLPGHPHQRFTILGTPSRSPQKA